MAFTNLQCSSIHNVVNWTASSRSSRRWHAAKWYTYHSNSYFVIVTWAWNRWITLKKQLKHLADEDYKIEFEKNKNTSWLAEPFASRFSCVCYFLLWFEHQCIRHIKPWPNGLASRRKFGRAQIWTQVDASLLPFGHPAQVNTSWSQVIRCYKNALTNDMREMYGFLRLANPFGHPSQVRTQVLVLQTCVDLRRLASPFGQGFRSQHWKVVL